MFYFVIWFLVSLILAYLLFKKTKIFRKKIGLIIAFSAAAVAAIAHNIFFFWLKINEPVFLFIAFLALGVGIFLLAVWLAPLFADIINSLKSRKN